MNNPEFDPPSPCIGVCMMNPATQLCEGCYRTIDEIADWWDLNGAAKQTVIESCADRQFRILDGTYFD